MTNGRLPRGRRTGLTALVAATVVFVSCGGDDDATPVADDPGATTTVAPDDDSATTVAATDDAATDDAATDDDPAAGEKPVVDLPEEIPTELVITDLIAGSGPAADVGDTVTVNYVGVLSSNGTEFDNSYDRGQPFPLVLGVGSVIRGWDEGLVGAQAGTRRQLDIPADLAYGDQERSEIIQPGSALTFVIDVVAVEKRPVPTAPPQADAADCPATDGSEPQQQSFDQMQPFCIDVTKAYTAEVVTNFGTFSIALDPAGAPQNVNNFVTLARYKYFDGTECHRVLTDFVVQCGDPEATGFGGPGYTIPDELPLPGAYDIGSIAMANIGQPNSAGSQFFIISGQNGAALPPQYSLFGDVAEGLEVIGELNTLENPDGDNGVPPLETITIETVTITEN